MSQRLDMSTGNRVHAVKDRAPVGDLYETPEVATRVLMAVEALPKLVYEPACGPGAIVRVLRDAGHTVIAHDLIDWGCPDSESRRDFLMEREAPAPTIVMNPPFMNAESFVSHALDLCPEVYALMRVAFLEGLRWEERRFRDHLCRVHVFAPRLPFMHRRGWDGPVNSNSAMPFSWMVFRRNWRAHGGQPTINWVNWKQMFPEEAKAARAKREEVAA